MLAVAAVPTAATLVYEWTTGDMPSNMIRALAGAPLGAASSSSSPARSGVSLPVRRIDRQSRAGLARSR